MGKPADLGNVGEVSRIDLFLIVDAKGDDKWSFFPARTWSDRNV